MNRIPVLLVLIGGLFTILIVKIYFKNETKMRFYSDYEKQQMRSGYTTQDVMLKRSLKQFEASQNAKCPIIMDEITILDSVKVSIPPASLKESMNFKVSYYYSLKDMDYSEVDWILVHRSMYGQIQKSYENSSDFEIFRDNDVELHYYYRDKNGKIGTFFFIKPEKNEDN